MKYIQIILLLSVLGMLACVHSNNSQQKEVINQETYSISDSLKKFVAFDNKQIVLINASVIDGTGREIQTKQTILIEDGVFKYVGDGDDFKTPADIKVIDVQGKTIIPGIVGVHNHLHIPGFPFIGEVATKLYLASGVTTIQTCGAASPSKQIALAKQIENGEQIGPDIFTSAPYFTGEGGSPSMIIPRSEKHIRDTMQYWIQQGVSWFKVYRHTNPKDLKVITDEAHKNNCGVTGHFCSITFEEATNLGIDGIEHGFNSASDFRTNKPYGICSGGREYMDELIISSAKVKRIQKLIIDSNVFLTSTLSIYEASVPNRAFADKRTLKSMSPFLINQYKERRSQLDKEEADLSRERRLKRIMEFEYQFYKMGGLLGSGADAGRHNLPGYGDQRNFELLREAGFSTEQAIQIMTNNGAKILKQENIGSIEIGKRADFIILDGNLEDNSSTIRLVEYVFKNGIGYDSEAIINSTNGKVGI